MIFLGSLLDKSSKEKSKKPHPETWILKQEAGINRIERFKSKPNRLGYSSKKMSARFELYIIGIFKSVTR